MLEAPVLAVNMKAYGNAFGSGARDLARAASRIASSTGVRVILVAPLVNAVLLASIYDDVYAQHADPVGFGAHTGFTPPEALAAEGVKGVLINHSEHKMLYRDVEKVAELAKKAGLEVLACADTPGEAAGLAYLPVDMIAVEPPELIGTGIPVSKAKPEVITGALEAVGRVRSLPVLAGAGITGGEDAARAVELGASGVLVASAVMKASNPEAKMRELAEAMVKLWRKM
ncbi:MAG: triose-phosphate isomerase [Desulfurococcales archaeon]|nr:triose-phosphate isomerase [Desulfurococcales archaeon]